jgi:UDP-glucose 4-epimerase
MKCVIFGGSGFIGSTLSDRLLLDGHSVRIFERPRVAQYRVFSRDESAEWVTGDFSSRHDVSRAVEGMDVVFHLISTSLPKSSNDDPIYDVESNVVSSLQLLNCMVEKAVPRIIFISSGGTVYGNPRYLPVDEAHPTNPIVSYGITKLAIEKYLQLYERLHGLTAISLRVANAYGERQRIETAQGAVAAFLHRARHDLPIEIWGDGEIVRDYVHVSDVAAALANAAVYTGEGRVFNISSGHGTSLNELIATLEAALGKSLTRRHLPGRTFDVPTSVLSNAFACAELRWEPRIGLRQGIEQTISWLDSQKV